MEHMKWWGWGEEKISFDHRDKPGMAPFVKEHIGIDFEADPAASIALDDIQLVEPHLPDSLRSDLVAAVGEVDVRVDRLERVVHSYGKSMRDLIRVRRGELGRPPDVVVYPRTEAAVELLVQAALRHNAVVIPFGGGTNISGSLEPEVGEQRTVVSLDMAHLDQVLEIDETSRLARVQAGVRGPHLEKQLKAQGWTIGHFPDSFNHSTLGGWIATRSSGMQSDKYGDIADLTKAIRMIGPKGTVATRPVPSASNGPSVKEMILGSEGRLGVITEATIHVHRIPRERVILAYLFPNWSASLKAMTAIANSDATPSITRVSDAKETQFSFATKRASSKADDFKSSALKVFLQRRKGFDLPQMCLSFIGYEGSAEHVKRQKRLVADIVKSHGGVGVGSGPGKLYDQKKFDTPYIRDFLLDRGGLADVSETATSWSKLEQLHAGTVSAANKAFDELGVKGWIMSHMSHSYHSGACLYFTFAFQPLADREAVGQYDVVKTAIQQAFIDNGGTLSHHHAVGSEHKAWMAEDVSEAGVAMVEGLFEAVDPGRNFNPDKIV